jgi:hypothetical protein
LLLLLLLVLLAVNTHRQWRFAAELQETTSKLHCAAELQETTSKLHCAPCLTSPTRSSSVVLCMMRVKAFMVSPPGIFCTSCMLAYLHMHHTTTYKMHG